MALLLLLLPLNAGMLAGDVGGMPFLPHLVGEKGSSVVFRQEIKSCARGLVELVLQRYYWVAEVAVAVAFWKSPHQL